MTIRELSDADMKVLRALRHALPWFVGLVVIPVLTWFFRLLWADSPNLWLVLVMLMLVGAGLTWLAYTRSHNRSSTIAKWISPAYTATATGFLTLTTAFGFGDIPDGLLFIMWLIGTGGLSLFWNRWHVRRDAHDITFDIPKPKIDTKAIRQAAMQALPPAAVPAAALPTLNGEVVSDVTTVTPEVHPEVAKAIAKVNADKAVMQAQAQVEAMHANAQKVIKGWKELVGLNVETGKATGPMRILAKCQISVNRNEDYCTELQLRLSDGVEPHHVEQFQGTLAGKYRRGINDIRIVTNGEDNSDVKVRVVWFNPLKETIDWQGPSHPGIWWGTQPIVFGRREDNTPARLLLPSNKKFGKPNSSHVLIEGVNGSGKSETMLVTVGEGVTQKGVCFWGIDIGKVLQTFGSIMPAIDWMVTDKAVAKIMIKAIIEAALPARGALFGSLGAKEWTPELAQRYGIPYIVLFVEEGGLIFEVLGRDMTKILMLARSLGFCIWGSMQRAQHENIDTNARAQFTEILTFGMQSDEDIFAMPDWLQEKTDASQWGNSMPGMHYHHTPLIPREEQVTPQRSMLTNPVMLRQVTEQYGPNMMAPEKPLVDALNRWVLKTKDDMVTEVYANRETGMDVERRLKSAGGIELGTPEWAETLAGPADAATPQGWQVAADGTVSPELAEATLRRGEELRAAGMVPQQRERIDLDRTAQARQAAIAADSEETPDELLGQWMNDTNEEALDAEEEPQMSTKLTAEQAENVLADDDTPFGIDEDEEEPDDMDVDDILAELNADLDDDEDVSAALAAVAAVDEDDDVEGFGGDDTAATARPSAFVMSFEDPEWDPKPSHADKEAARRNLLRVLAGYGPGYIFRAADLYGHPEVGYVNRSDSWIRGALIDLSEEEVYVEVINDPRSQHDGWYRTTERIAQIPRLPATVS